MKILFCSYPTLAMPTMIVMTIMVCPLTTTTATTTTRNQNTLSSFYPFLLTPFVHNATPSHSICKNSETRFTSTLTSRLGKCPCISFPIRLFVLYYMYPSYSHALLSLPSFEIMPFLPPCLFSPLFA
ncbi:hypothetical protein K457DRAFT_1117559 [Linnemannia elongata AG-77]|uniref:Uncharacterized protein n=1 Tax=Linnemannia elongata AG-77 TaxID=1314771 RepID=A0A197K7X7_9FUNG|nr:hypothetical protein K457DRAFT_1117559 [Linnemannia elongata AG-77]